MKAKISILVGWMLLCTAIQAQTLFFQDNFELAGAPDIAAGSSRVAENNGGSGGTPFTSYFCRTPGTSAVSQSTAFSGFVSSNYWAGEDHDTPFGAGNEEQQIEWQNISITGITSLTFRGFFGANSGNGSWDNFNTGSGAPGFGVFANPSNDYIIVEYAIGAAAYTQLIAFFGDNITGPIGTAKKLKEDTNGDFIGDGGTLDPTMTEFVKAIPGSGSTMKLRIRVFSNGGNEEWGIDNFRLLGSVLPVSWSHFDLEQHNQGIQLRWGTTSEVGSDYFAIEHSQDGVQFTEIGRVDAAHTSNASLEYGYYDAEPAVGQHYYRIRQVDLDGQYILSDAIEARVADPAAIETSAILADGYANIRLSQPAQSIVLTDLSGNSLPVPMQRTSDQVTLDVGQLAPGMYIARIAYGSSVATRRIVVQ